MKRIIIIGLLLLLVLFAICIAQEQSKVVVQNKVAIKARPFDLSQVRLLDGPFKDAMDLNRKYLLDLDSDRLLHNFRVTADLPSSAQTLGGWEEPKGELRGHSVGHFLSGCALTYAATGDTALKDKAEKMVAELAKCQKALGTSGYLSAYPESFFDRVEKRERVWAPYYTLHKILAGLLDVYTYCGDKQALDVAVGIARWCKGRCDKLNDQQMEAMLNATEQGGMNEVLCSIYAAAGEPWILQLARHFDEKAYTEPLYKHQDNMTDQHVNSFIPNIIGSAREYELTGNDKEHEIATWYWDQVANHRSYATGGTSNGERWQVKADILSTQLGNNAHESCCTYNILKLTRHLFTWDPQAATADFYERGIYNGILSTIHPKTGMTMYYVPMAPGAYKTFGTPNNSFWCCTGTGMENHAKYGDSIYFYDDQGLYVNLFIASELNWTQKGLVIRQETKIPQEDKTSLIIKTSKPQQLLIRVRVPYWATNGVKVSINGKPQTVSAKPVSYLVLNRTWQNGDRIDVQLPMSLHTCPTPDNKGVFAIMYGPLVLAGELGTEGMQQPSGVMSPRSGPAGVEVPDLIGIEGKNINDWLKPVAGEELVFKTEGVGKPKDVSLIPFYRLYDQRYTVYWKAYKDEAAQKEGRAKDAAAAASRRGARGRGRGARTIDSIQIGNDANEIAHQLQGDRIVHGTYNERSFVQVNTSGFLSVRMRVLPNSPVVLMCSYWGADTGNREFDIFVEDTKIATQKIQDLSPGQFVNTEYKIPESLTKGKETVMVKFVPLSGNIAGGIYGISILRPAAAN